MFEKNSLILDDLIDIDSGKEDHTAPGTYKVEQTVGDGVIVAAGSIHICFLKEVP
jgi:hypothetical protein